MPGYWVPKHKKAARMKAKAVANYINNHREIYGNTPIRWYIAADFDRSTAWVTTYIRLAREYGYLKDPTEGVSKIIT